MPTKRTGSGGLTKSTLRISCMTANASARFAFVAPLVPACYSPMFVLFQVILALALVGIPAPATGTHSGREGKLDVEVPRIEGSAEVDGHLDEPVWGQAARLADFSQYAPVDHTHWS